MTLTMKPKHLLLALLLLLCIAQAEAANSRPPFIVIDYTYDDARDFHEGLAAVKSRDRWGYIDYLGRIAIPFVHKVPEAGDFSDGFAFVGDTTLTRTETRRSLRLTRTPTSAPKNSSTTAFPSAKD